jgi:hypothetical protein
MDVDGSRASGPLVSEDRLQPDGARTSVQPTAARSRNTELPGRSAERRNMGFTISDSTSVNTSTSIGSSVWGDEAQTPVDAVDAYTFDPPAP